MRILALMLLTALVPGCLAQASSPLGESDVRRAFAAEGVELIRTPIGEDAWVTILAADETGVEVQIYSAPEVAETFAESFAAFAGPPTRIRTSGPPPRPLPDPPQIRRHANVLVLTDAHAPPAVERLVERARARLGPG